MRKMGSSSKSQRGGKLRAVAAGRHVTERLAGYKREVARLTEEIRGQRRLLDALLLPIVQLENTGPFKLPSHLLHCSSSSVGVSVDPEGPGPGALSKCKQTKVKEEMEDHEIRDHDEAGDPRAAGDPEKAGSEATDSDMQSGHLEEIVNDLSSGIKTEDSEGGDCDYYPQEPCKLTPQTQGKKYRPRRQSCRPTPQSCKVCPASFPNRKLFLQHIHEHYQECAWCGLCVWNPQSLKAHLETHTQCPGCEKTFHSYVSLKKHIWNYVPDKNFGCAECGKQFKARQGLDRHAKCHTGEKPPSCRPTPQSCRPTPQSCKVCPASFPNRKLFMRHIREHKQECAWCGLRVRATQSLSAHLQTHTQCPGCEKTFHSYRNLKRHLWNYLPDKNFSCAECGKQFMTRQNLYYHEKSHTGEKPFSCTICHVKFIRKGSMVKHMKAYHS